MGLVTKQGPKVAKKDIVCYKLMIAEECHYKTFFQGTDAGEFTDGITLCASLSQSTLNDEKEKYKKLETRHICITEKYPTIVGYGNYNPSQKCDIAGNIKILEHRCKFLTDGYIHTYKSMKDMSNNTLTIDGIDVREKIRIVKCIIPKGAIYYSGYCYSLDSDYNVIRFGSYASSSIVMLKDITDKYKNKLSILYIDDMTEEQRKKFAL